jgi:serine/threonine protein kinase
MADPESLGGEYLLHEEIGRGALAVVRRATSRLGGPPLAAKLLRPEFAGDRRVRDLFLREEAALRDLDHPGIVGIRDLVVERGRLALLMDYVDGPNLRRHLAERGGRLPAAEAAGIAAQAAAALAAAHAQGVVHLDLKPENILLVRGTDPPVIRITDFGVAALLLDADREVAGGTPGYTAPEVLRGAPVTAAADVYSLGALLVELIEGSLPGDPETSLPEPLRTLARECLAADPRSRPSARAVAARLRSAGTIQAPPVAENLWADETGQYETGQRDTDQRDTRLRPGVTPPVAPQPAPAPVQERWRRGPLLTLAGAVVVAGLLVVNTMADAQDRLDRKAAIIAIAPTTSAEATAETPGPPANLPPTEGVAVADHTRATFVGHVDNDAGTLAISLRDGVAIAYICDGNRVEAWLRGTAAAGRLSLKGKNGAAITATFDAGHARGKVTVIGRTNNFTLAPATKPSGLYRTAAKVKNAKVVGSWIVLPDGRQVGVLTEGDAVGPAPALDVGRRTATVDGTAVSASSIDVDSGEGF